MFVVTGALFFFDIFGFGHLEIDTDRPNHLWLIASSSFPLRSDRTVIRRGESRICGYSYAFHIDSALANREVPPITHHTFVEGRTVFWDPFPNLVLQERDASTGVPTGAYTVPFLQEQIPSL